MAYNYDKAKESNPEKNNLDGILLFFPNEETLRECLKNHQLTQSNWLQEKGFLRSIAEEFENRKLYYPLGLQIGLKSMLMDNFINRHDLDDKTWVLIEYIY